jgi:hypothetical protein
VSDFEVSLSSFTIHDRYVIQPSKDNKSPDHVTGLEEERNRENGTKKWLIGDDEDIESGASFLRKILQEKDGIMRIGYNVDQYACLIPSF